MSKICPFMSNHDQSVECIGNECELWHEGPQIYAIKEVLGWCSISFLPDIYEALVASESD